MLLGMTCTCSYIIWSCVALSLSLHPLAICLLLSGVYLTFLSHLLISKSLLPCSCQEFDWFYKLYINVRSPVLSILYLCRLMLSPRLFLGFTSLCVCMCVWYIYCNISHRSISCSYISVTPSCMAFTITTVIHCLAKDYKSHDYRLPLTRLTTAVFSFIDSSVVCLRSVVCGVFLMKYLTHRSLERDKSCSPVGYKVCSICSLQCVIDCNIRF